MKYAFILVTILMLACNDGSGTECPVGSEGCTCTGGGSCDSPLVCVDETCQQESLDTSTDSEEDSVPDSIPDTPVESECAVDLDCDDDDPCTSDSCDTDFGECVHGGVDEDGDGYSAAAVGDTDCGGDDCDDTLDSVHPGITVTDCSFEDTDCSGQPDWDEDADGYQSLALCPTHGTDCDDYNPDAWPGADETCDVGVDLDCNGEPDLDNDGDGHDDADCSGGDDCDDLSPTVYGGAAEVCLDGIDQDCDDVVDGPVMDGTPIQLTNNHVTCEHPVIEQGSGGSSGGFTISWSEEIVSGSSQLKYVATDPTWIYDVINATSDHSTPTTVPDFSGRYRMTWVDERDGNREIYYGRYFTMMMSAGIANHRITNNSYSSNSPAIASISTADGVGLSWSDSRDGNQEIYFALIEDDGDRITTDIRITDTSNQSQASTIVWSGSEFGLAWQEYSSTSTIYFTRIGTDGVRTGSDVLVNTTSDNETSPALQWTGSQYGLTWVVDDPLSSGWIPVPISFAVISSTGVVESVEEYTVQSTAAPALAWTGSEYGLVYARGGEVFLDRVAVDGNLVGPRAVHDAGGNIENVDIVWSDDEQQFGVTWDTDADGDFEVWYATYDLCE